MFLMLRVPTQGRRIQAAMQFMAVFLVSRETEMDVLKTKRASSQPAGPIHTGTQIINL